MRRQVECADVVAPFGWTDYFHVLDPAQDGVFDGGEMIPLQRQLDTSVGDRAASPISHVWLRQTSARRPAAFRSADELGELLERVPRLFPGVEGGVGIAGEPDLVIPIAAKRAHRTAEAVLNVDCLRWLEGMAHDVDSVAMELGQAVRVRTPARPALPYFPMRPML